MDRYETEARKKGFRFIAGLDEAGRGPLAGPVVAAAVIFAEPPAGSSINDSKKLTPKKRESLVFEIYSRAASVSVGLCWPAEIDEMNIHRASLLAMERAAASLSIPPDYLLVDGRFPIRSELAQLPVISGDSLSVSIAAASIIAKTTRDRLMEAYDRMYPGYGFKSHKGYPTKAHLAGIASLGPTPIHRRTFRGVPPEARP